MTTEGQTLLVRALESRSQTWLANVLNLNQSSISGWTRGLSRPEPEHRLSLEILLGIPQASWLLPEEVEAVDRVRAIVETEKGAA